MPDKDNQLSALLQHTQNMLQIQLYYLFHIGLYFIKKINKLVCRKQLNTSGVTLNEPKTHHQTPMTTYGYSHFMHVKTGATEVEIPFISTLISLLAQFGSAFFSSKEGVPVLLSI